MTSLGCLIPHLRPRFAFEWLYSIILGQVMAAVIVAVLIDAMQELRFNRLAALDDLRTRCFVCDLKSVTLEQAGIDFTHHTHHVHNPQHYMSFLIYLRQKNTVDLTAVERYVAETVWRGENGICVAWLPQQQTWMMSAGAQPGEQEENDAGDPAAVPTALDLQMRNLQEQVKVMQSQLTALSSKLLQSQ